MKCPVCENVELLLAERERVEIDYCPTCRGVWLDRGELDKVIERYDQGSRHERDDENRGRDDDRDDDGDRDRTGGGDRGRRRKSLLSEFFDVG